MSVFLEVNSLQNVGINELSNSIMNCLVGKLKQSLSPDLETGPGHEVQVNQNALNQRAFPVTPRQGDLKKLVCFTPRKTETSENFLEFSRFANKGYMRKINKIVRPLIVMFVRLSHNVSVKPISMANHATQYYQYLQEDWPCSQCEVHTVNRLT